MFHKNRAKSSNNLNALQIRRFGTLKNSSKTDGPALSKKKTMFKESSNQINLVNQNNFLRNKFARSSTITAPLRNQNLARKTTIEVNNQIDEKDENSSLS